MPQAYPRGRTQRGAAIGWLVDALQHRLDPRTTKRYRYTIDWDAGEIAVAGRVVPLTEARSIWITRSFKRVGTAPAHGTLSMVVGEFDLVGLQSGRVEQLEAFAEAVAGRLGCPIRRTNF